MKKIIAFGHRKRTGKDTVTKYLVTELKLRFPGINIQKHGYADKVKDICTQIFGWAGLKSGEYYDRQENLSLKEEKLPLLNKSPRELWIGCGNGIRTATGLDGVWSDYLLNTIKCDVLIISDLRFPAEAEDILKYNGFIYRIDRNSVDKVIDGADDKLEDFTKWTGVIENNKGFKELHNEAMKLVERHFL